jgi:hypothetical protein
VVGLWLKAGRKQRVKTKRPHCSHCIGERTDDEDRLLQPVH